MGMVYVYPSDAESCHDIGLCGALMPTECRFSLEAGEFGELTMKHPRDPYGKWKELQNYRILKAEVPCRLVPNMTSASGYVSTVEEWRVSTSADSKARVLAKKTDGKGKVAVLDVGQLVTVIRYDTSSQMYYVKADKVTRKKTKTYAGWVKASSLASKVRDVEVSPTASGGERVNKSYTIQAQLFRIYSVTTSDSHGGEVTVKARRLAYDLLGNLCTAELEGDVSGLSALRAVLDGCAASHGFTGYSDIGDTRAALSLKDINPIEAICGTDGIVQRWGAELISDDYDLYLLHDAGMDRGVRIEYAKNLTGISCEVDVSNVAFGVLPYGEDADGARLYLTGAETLPDGYSFDTAGKVVYASGNEPDVPKLYPLSVSGAKVTKELPINQARALLAEEAVKVYENGGAEPKITLKVEYVQLGDTEEYAQYRRLEDVFLYDSVRVIHKPLGISKAIACVGIDWDVLRDRPESGTFGSVEDVSSGLSWSVSNGGTVGSGSSVLAVLNELNDSTSALYQKIIAITR